MRELAPRCDRAAILVRDSITREIVSKILSLNAAYLPYLTYFFGHVSRI